MELLNVVKRGDVLCFGEPDDTSGFDGKWLVLDPAHTSMGTEGMFLVSLNLVGSETGDGLLFRDIGDTAVSFFDRGGAYASEHPGVTDYRGSDIQRWCEGFPERHFSPAERMALIPTKKSDGAITIPGLGIPLPGAAAGTVDFDPAEQVLDGDRVFLLSVEEAVDPRCGFSDNRARVACYKGEAKGYWLRSPHIPTFPLDVGFVFPFGALMDYPVNAKSLYRMDAYARPACNLDSARISSLERLSGSDGVSIWRVGFEGGERNGRDYDLSLPQVGELPDLPRMAKRAFAVATAAFAALGACGVWLAVKNGRKNARR